MNSKQKYPSLNRFHPSLPKIAFMGLALTTIGVPGVSLFSANAAVVTWNSGNAGDLTDVANYTGEGTIDNTADILFSDSAPTAAGTVQLGAVGGITATSASVQSINDINSNTITIGNNSSSSTASNATLTLGGATGQANTVTGADPADLIYLGGAASTMTIQGSNLRKGQSTGTGTLGLALAQSGNFNVANAGILNISAVISGAVNLTKTGSGILTLSGANTFGGTGHSLTLNSGTLNINNASALGDASNTVNINGGTIDNTSGAAITLSNYAQNWNGDFTFKGTNDLNLGTGNISLGNTAGATRIITVNSHNLTVGGIISDGTDPTTPTTNLVKTGAGTLVLSKANTYSGVTSILAGSVTITSGNAFGAGTSDVLLGDTAGSSNTTLTLGSATTAVTLSRNITVQSGNTGTAKIILSAATNGGTASTYNGALTLGSDNAGHDATLVLNGLRNGTATGGFTGVIRDPAGLVGTAGVLTITTSSSYVSVFFGNTANSYSGGTVINVNNTGSSMTFASGNIFGSGTVTIQAPLTISQTWGGANVTGTNAQIWNGNITISSSSLSVGWGLTGAIDLGSTGSATTRMLTNNSTTNAFTIAGSMQDGSNGTTKNFTKAGAGTLILTAASTYSGTTTISNGKLQLSSGNDRLPTGTTLLIQGQTASGGAAGSFDMNAKNQTVAGLSGGGISGSGVTYGKITNSAAGTSTLTVNPDNGVTPSDTTFDGIIANGSASARVALTKAGSHQLTLTGVNTYTGPTTVTGGTLALSGNGTLGAQTAALAIQGGTVDLGTTSQTVGAVTLTADGSALKNGSLTGASYAVSNTSGTTTISANLMGTGVSLTKTEAGTMTVAGNNSYTGNTNIKGGIAIISGSIAASSTTVGDTDSPTTAAKLIAGSSGMGEASVKDISAVTSSAVIAPGTDVNIASVLNTNGLSLTNGAHLAIDIGGTTVGGNVSTGYDRVNVLGALSADISGGVLDLTTLGQLSLAPDNELLFLVVNNGFDAASLPFSSVTLNTVTVADTSAIVIGGVQFKLVYDANYDGTTGNYGGTAFGGNDIALLAVPEPQTWAIIMSGGGILVLLQRRKTREQV